MSRLPVSLAATAAVAALGLTLVTTTVIATPASYDPRAIEVEYGDLDLAHAGDAAELYRRIEAAARNACDAGDPRDASASRRADQCVAQAVSGAVTRVDRAALTVLHRARAARPQKA